MSQQLIPIVMAVNSTYCFCASVTINSIIANKSRNSRYKIYILFSNLTLSEIEKLETLSKEDVQIEAISITAYLPNSSDLLYPRAHFSTEMYYRWWISELLPQHEKVLYLDCDTVVLRDLAALFQTDLTRYTVAGVVDFATPRVRNRINTQLGLNAEEYINSGVLLVNTFEWNRKKCLQKCLHLLYEMPVLPCPDQDVLNMVCRDSIYLLPVQWNAQWHHFWDSKDDQREPPFMNYFQAAIAEPYILHYSSRIKPWNCVPNQYSDLYFSYTNNSPFY